MIFHHHFWVFSCDIFACLQTILRYGRKMSWLSLFLRHLTISCSLKNNLEMYQLWKQSTVEVLQLFEQYYDAKESLLLLLQWRLSFNSNIATGTCVVYMFSYKRKKQPSLSWPVLKRKLSPALTYISLLRTNTLHRSAWINRLGVKISRTLAAALCLPYVWVCGPTQVWM